MHKAPVAVFLGSAPELMLLVKGSEAGVHGGLRVQALSVWISRPMLRWLSFGFHGQGFKVLDGNLEMKLGSMNVAMTIRCQYPEGLFVLRHP